MGRLTLALLWHMHQPYYVDLSQGRATLPWVRLHALKDYFDIPSLARRFPSVHQTFNLVPSLLDQLDGYASGDLGDPFLDAALRKASELTLEDRSFLLREYFSYNPPTMAADLPRLEELRRKRGARPPDPSDHAAFAAWRESDYRDLQVLFHLAWSGRELRSRPEVKRLIAQGSGFHQDDLEAVLSLQRSFVGEIEGEYRHGAEEGTLELSATPYYHPILPLLCDSGSARDANGHLPLPTPPFRHPEDAVTQVRRARAAFAHRFGSPPPGMWPSEGAISDAALRILAEEGVRWAASDEELLFASLKIAPGDLAERSRILHRPYVGPGGVVLFFRDHELSDRIGFVYSSWDPQTAADDFMGRLGAIAGAAGGEHRVVAVILDGENAWEYYPENGAPFLSALFSRLAGADWVRARTFTEALDVCVREGPAPAPLQTLRAGSWIRADLTTWIGDPAKNRAWGLLAEARAALGAPSPDTPAGASLLAAEGSDWFWWFGSEHTSAHDPDFDRTFRIHLQNAYALAGKSAPVSLASPVDEGGPRPRLPSPTGPVRVSLDGKVTDYFEWLPAARLGGEIGQGTMSRTGRGLAALYYGADQDHLALRVDARGGPARETLAGHVLVIEFSAPQSARVRVPLREGMCGDAPTRACLGTVLEALVPVDGLAHVRDVSFRILLEDDAGHRLEALPADGFITFTMDSKNEEWFV